MIDKIEQNYIVKALRQFFQNKNEHAYIVGGYLRDCMLGIHSTDIDVVVSKGKARVLAHDFADTINGYFVELDNTNNIYRVVFENKLDYVDFADCVGNSIEEDLKRRDFTINAIAYDLTNNCIVDTCNGQEDIKKSIIREISEENITDDPIRILRAFRFQSILGFELSNELKNVIKEHATLLNTTAKERINTELIKLFAGKNVVAAIHALDEYKILEMLIPEVKEIKKIPPNSHHHLPLIEHSIETVRQVQIYYENSKGEVKEHFDELLFGGISRIAYLKFAAFLHDVGKPVTWKIEPDTGRHRFIMHDTEGAKIIVPTLKNLKFSKKQIAYIQTIIKNHIYPASLVTTPEKNNKAYMRFYRKMGNEVIDLIAIAHADRLSAQGPAITKEITDKNISGLKELLEYYLESKNMIKPLPKLLDGNEIADILQIKPSPQLGKIIEELKEAQISSVVNTKEEAIKYVKGFKIY